MCASNPATRRAARGSTLIELMVGIVVALLVGLVAMGMAISFAATQRQAVGTSGVSSSGANALELLRTQALGAGLGFFGSSSYRCNRLNLSHGSSLLWDGASFSPLTVTRSSSDWGDTLTLLKASSVYGGSDVPVVTAGDTAASLKSHLPAAVGQAVLLSPASAGTACTVRSITSITAASSSSFEQLAFASSDTDGAYNQGRFTSPASYAAGDRIALLGALSAYRYRLSNNTLQQLDLIAGTTATLARNVMAFRVQYGVSVSASVHALDSWVEPTGSWAALDSSNLNRVLALRLQLLVRSTQPEKPNTSSKKCEATPSSPQLITGETYPLSETDKCFRYRLVTSVVPLRNVIAGLQ